MSNCVAVRRENLFWDTGSLSVLISLFTHYITPLWEIRQQFNRVSPSVVWAKSFFHETNVAVYRISWKKRSDLRYSSPSLRQIKWRPLVLWEKKKDTVRREVKFISSDLVLTRYVLNVITSQEIFFCIRITCTNKEFNPNKESKKQIRKQKLHTVIFHA